jgi:serine/threonine protein kinase
VRASSRQTLGLPAAAEDTASAIPDLAPPPDYPFLAPPQAADEVGRLGPYRILRVLGTGAMGVVFQAEDPHLKRLVALKVLRPSLAASADFHRRFLREAQLAAAIDHEHIVPVYQVGEDRGVPFLAMKLLRGETLEDRLHRAGGRLPLAEVLRVGREIAEGLAAAHDQGLIHRDIKPANIWLEAGTPAGTLKGGRVKIVDFGLARGSGPDAQFTQAGAVIGTPAYMAPEQANAAEVDARCDLFSLGVVLYRACTGTLPFGGKDTLSVLSALATQTPPTPHQFVPAVPRACSVLVMRLLAKDPADRPQSAREVVEAIEALERGQAADQDEVPEARGCESEEAASPPAVAEGARERAAESGVKRKGSKKTRRPASRSKKRAQAGRDWGRLVLVAALVLLGVAVLVLLVAVVRHATKARAAASEAPASLRVARLDGAPCVTGGKASCECQPPCRKLLGFSPRSTGGWLVSPLAAMTDLATRRRFGSRLGQLLQLGVAQSLPEKTTTLYPSSSAAADQITPPDP